MDLSKLNSADTVSVRDYIEKKFKTFKSFPYSRSSRTKKCEKYYLAASGREVNQDIIQEVYQRLFGEILDTDKVEAHAARQAAKKSDIVKIEAGQWLQAQNNQADDVAEMLSKLRRWREDGSYQEGEGFFVRLKTEVEEFDETMMDTASFKTDFSAQCRAAISGGIALGPKEINAQYNLMVGFNQSTEISFKASGVNWGEVNGKLEESFKAGIWSSGNAKLKLENMGFSLEAQAAIAMGAQLDIAGTMQWTKGRSALTLGGNASVSAGAQASGQIKLSMNARKGLEASIQAGAFVGFSATAGGSCSFAYDDKELVSASGSASITFGIGASFEGSINAPIFGPTSIGFGGNLTMGLGAEVKTEVAINFSEVGLASSTAFRQLVYWRTMARGYEMTLMNSDARNLFYLNKVILRLEAEELGLGESIASYKRVPEEKRSLLMEVA